MTDTQLQNYRLQLLALQSRLQTDQWDLTDEALGQNGGQASANLSHLPTHLADLGSDSFEQQVTLSLVENQQHTLEEITAALERIEQGTYGRCEACHQKIRPARLEALPYTRYCVRCAQDL